MAILLKGAPVAEAIVAEMSEKIRQLKEKDVVPTLAILRVGENGADISYERNARKRCEKAGAAVKSVVLPEDVDQNLFFSQLDALNSDPLVHGILLLRPLPKQLDSSLACRSIAFEKDIDGCTGQSLEGVFVNRPYGFPPCTAQAVMEILQYYQIPLKGKTAAVIGRSLVVGRPAAMLLMHQNATPIICHTGTKDVAALTRAADIVVAASGKTETLGKEYFREGQVILDVGTGWNEEKQKLCGDVIFEEAEPLAEAITPVPGGVGAVTTSVLLKHLVIAAERLTDS